MSSPGTMAVMSILRTDGTVAVDVSVMDDGSVVPSGNLTAAEILLPIVTDRLVKYLKQKEGV